MSGLRLSIQIVGLLCVLQGLSRFLLFQQGFGQLHVGQPVAGLELHRILQRQRRAVDVLLLPVYHAQKRVGACIFLIRSQAFLQCLLRGCYFPLVEMGHAQLHVGFIVLRVERNGLLEVGDAAVGPILFIQLA